MLLTAFYSWTTSILPLPYTHIQVDILATILVVKLCCGVACVHNLAAFKCNGCGFESLPEGTFFN